MPAATRLFHDRFGKLSPEREKTRCRVIYVTDGPGKPSSDARKPLTVEGPPFYASAGHVAAADDDIMASIEHRRDKRG